MLRVGQGKRIRRLPSLLHHRKGKLIVVANKIDVGKKYIEDVDCTSNSTSASKHVRFLHRSKGVEALIWSAHDGLSR
jgi:hypothetical protein